MLPDRVETVSVKDWLISNPFLGVGPLPEVPYGENSILLNFSNVPPVPPKNLSTGEPVVYPLTWDFTDPVKIKFWSVTALLNPPSGVLAIVVFVLSWGGLTLFLSSRCCLTTIPVETEVLEGTYSLIVLNKELSIYFINL